MLRLRNCIRVVIALALVLAATSVLAGENPNPRPFWGHFEGEVTFPASDACLGITGAPYQTVSIVEGNMTHLGRTDLITIHCSTLDGSAAVDGHGILTSANGDEVWVIYTATTVIPPPPLIVQEADIIIVGGTGRFEGASGRLDGMVYVTFEGFADPSWPIRFVVAGWIVY